MLTLVKNLPATVWLKHKVRKLNRDQRGQGVENIMWIALGVLILVAVVGVVAYFMGFIGDQANDVLPGGGGDSGELEKAKNFGGK